MAYNRARLAARAAANPRATSSTGPATNLLARTSTISEPYGWTGTRRHGNNRSSKGGSGDMGVHGMWATVSPTFKTPETIDSKWSQTLSTQQVRGAF